VEILVNKLSSTISGTQIYRFAKGGNRAAAKVIIPGAVERLLRL
jgi:hypothetical protein